MPNSDNYNTTLFDQNLTILRKGFVVLIIAFTLFLYADFKVFMYPVIISGSRIFIILYFLFAVLSSHMLSLSQKSILAIYYIGLALILAFASMLIIVLDGTYASRAIQAYVVILLGCIIFASLCRRYMSELIVINLMLLILSKSIYSDFSLLFLFDHFNIIALTLALVVFNKVYYSSLQSELTAKANLQTTVNELKEEIRKSNLLEAKLKEMATKDLMTGCFSRNAGIDLLKNHMMNASTSGQPLSITYLDINQLKYINDHYGHTLGDHYIIQFVTLINRHLKASDLLIRLGGDEFLLILPNTDYKEAEQVWMAIVEAFKHAPIEEIDHIIISASHGTTQYDPELHTSLDLLLEMADTNMYHEKRAHRTVFNKRAP